MATTGIPIVPMESLQAGSSAWEDEFGGTMHSWRLGGNSDSNSDDAASESVCPTPCLHYTV